MQWLNYHHLFYFYTVAKEGSVVAAAAKLRLSQPTISTQLKQLEDSLGHTLFERRGKRLVLSEAGRLSFKFADEIFSLGEEFKSTLGRGEVLSSVRKVRIGVTDSLPKLVCYRILEPLLSVEPPAHPICVEGKHQELLSRLATYELDLVLADAPNPGGTSIRAFNHLLGQCGVSFFGVAKLATRYKRGFPASLDAAPLLLPIEGTMLRASLDRWFDDIGIRPRTVGEIEDSALIKVFGESGEGLFPVPSIIEQDVKRHYKVSLVGRLEEVNEQFYLITLERRIKNPVVSEIISAARGALFGE